MDALMGDVIHVSEDRARRLSQMARLRGTTAEALVESAIDRLLDSGSPTAQGDEARAWRQMSAAALDAVWDNDADRAYDDWRSLHGIPER